jgi:hypothetical protein
MKHANSVLAIFVAMVAGSCYVEARQDASQQLEQQIVNLSDLNDDVIRDFSEGKRSDFIIQCKEGNTLLFKLALDGEFLSLESVAPTFLKVRKSCYVRCDQKQRFLFSSDLETWKEFSEFFTGELKTSLFAKNGQPEVALELQLNQKRK